MGAESTQKVLTREDLLYILNSIFRLSNELNNAFQVLEDGIYVEDYKTHASDENLHINTNIKDIVSKLSIENGILHYDGKIVGIVVSQETDNAIEVKPDGLYVQLIPDTIKDHIESDSIHVSEKDREKWDKTLEDAKDFTLDEINKLIILDIQEVVELPEPIGTPFGTLYVLKEEESTDETEYTWYINIKDKFLPISITKRTLDLYLTKKEIEEKYYLKENAHDHQNSAVLEKISEDTDGNLVYNGTEISKAHISELAGNAVRSIDGKIYVEDLSAELRSLQLASSFNKTNLLNQECTEAGTYELKDTIDNFNLLLIEYYHKSDDETKLPGNAKTATVDVDTLNELYKRGIDYCLELGYGINNSVCKFHMNQGKLVINYYHNICIYKITGIGRSDE